MVDDNLRLPTPDSLGPTPRPERLDLRDAGAAVRLLLRGSRGVVDAAGAAFGVALPAAPCRANSSGESHALWLGPDEWLLIGPEGDPATLAATIAAAIGREPCSLVNVSDGAAALIVSGSPVTDVLNAGCPLDLGTANFPVGMCARTLLGKAGIILWRLAPLTFRLEASRSYMPYVLAFLREADIANQCLVPAFGGVDLS